MIDREPYDLNQQVYYNDSKWKVSVKTTILKARKSRSGKYRYQTDLFTKVYMGGRSSGGKLTMTPQYIVVNNPNFLYIEEERKSK